MRNLASAPRNLGIWLSNLAASIVVRCWKALMNLACMLDVDIEPENLALTEKETLTTIDQVCNATDRDDRSRLRLYKRR